MLSITVIAVAIVILEVISQFIARKLLANRIYFGKIRPSYDIYVIKSRRSDFEPNVYFIFNIFIFKIHQVLITHMINCQYVWIYQFFS